MIDSPNPALQWADPCRLAGALVDETIAHRCEPPHHDLIVAILHPIRIHCLDPAATSTSRDIDTDGATVSSPHQLPSWASGRLLKHVHGLRCPQSMRPREVIGELALAIRRDVDEIV